MPRLARMPRAFALGCTSAATALAIAACDSSPTAPAPIAGAPAASVGQHVTVPFDPSSFVGHVTNPFFPLVPGTVFHYRSKTPDGTETNRVAVTGRTKQILGVTTTVVHDQVFLEGELTEDTFDWYAQDVHGNVWYLGEDSKELEHGKVVSTEGSWEAGRDGARAGILMLAHPDTDLAYAQERAAGVAEDRARVLVIGERVRTPYGRFHGCVKTLEWTLLDPTDREHKFYCRGTGLVAEVQFLEPERTTNELVAITHFTPSGEQ